MYRIKKNDDPVVDVYLEETRDGDIVLNATRNDDVYSILTLRADGWIILHPMPKEVLHFLGLQPIELPYVVGRDDSKAYALPRIAESLGNLRLGFVEHKSKILLGLIENPEKSTDVPRP